MATTTPPLADPSQSSNQSGVLPRAAALEAAASESRRAPVKEFVALTLSPTVQRSISAQSPYRFLAHPDPDVESSSSSSFVVVEPYIPLDDYYYSEQDDSKAEECGTWSLILTPPRSTDIDLVVECLNDFEHVSTQLVGPPYPYSRQDWLEWSEMRSRDTVEQFETWRVQLERHWAEQQDKTGMMINSESAPGREDSEDAVELEKFGPGLPFASIRTRRRRRREKRRTRESGDKEQRGRGEAEWSEQGADDNGNDDRDGDGDGDDEWRWIGEVGVCRWEFRDVDDLVERKRLVSENDARKVGDPDLVWSFGYYLSREYQGRGIMTRVVSSLFQRVFVDYLDAHVVRSSAFVDNVASIRVQEKCGLRRRPVGPNDKTFSHAVSESRGGGTRDEVVLEWTRPSPLEPY